jgi:hypothetical protein
MNFDTMSKQRKFVLITAAVGVISMFLPWFSFFGYRITGMHGIGILVFLCFVVAGVIAWLGDQTKNLNKTMWLVTLISGALATLIIIGRIIDASGSIIGLLSFGIYLAALAAIGVLLSAFLLRSPTDNIKDSFESLKQDINTKINTTPTTQDVTKGPNTTTNNDAEKNTVDYVKYPEDIDNPGK